MGRSRTRLAAALAASSLAACSSAYDVTLTPPADVAWVGLVRTDGVPSTAQPPGLLPVDGAALLAEIALADQADAPWQAVGYRAADLDGLALPSATILAATPLTPVAADACWSLRAPAWSEAVTDAARSAPPAVVSVPWARRCPATAERSYDVRCGVPHLLCGINTAPGDCVDTLDANLCPDTAPRVAIERDGRACLLAEPIAGCVRSTNPEGGARWVCGACTFDDYPGRAPLALTVHTTRVSPPVTPVLRPNVLPSSTLDVGHLRALVVRGERVWLATAVPISRSSVLCEDHTTLHDIDPETLAARRSVPLAGCVSGMIADAAQGGLLTATYRGLTLVVTRLDADGREVQTATVARPAAALGLPAGRVVLAVLGARLLLAEQLNDGGVEDTAWVHLLDPTTLAPLAAPRPAVDRISGFALVRADTLLITRNDGINLIPIDTPVIPPATQLVPKSELHGPQVLSGRRALLIDSGGVSGMVDVDVERSSPVFERGARVFERPALITSAEAIEGAGPAPLLGVALAHDGGRRWTAALATLDASEDLRVRPGLLPVEHGGAPVDGPLTALQRDARGRVWALAPWAGLLVRIDL